MIYFTSMLYSMDHAPIINNQMIAWKIILTHGVRYFDCRQISILAINKNFKKLLKETAGERKHYLRLTFKSESDSAWNTMIWHKYGAMCGKASIQNNELRRSRFYVHQSSYGCTRYYQPGDGLDGHLMYYLPGLLKPYFNNRSNFCFYAYDEFQKRFAKRSGRIVQYKWNSSKNIAHNADLVINQCITNIKNKYNQYIDLRIFLEFPVLLKAFLKSKVTYKKEKKRGMNQKIYAIEGVTIPENYKDRKQYFPTPVYTSFEDLPQCIRKAIVARYKEQGKNDFGINYKRKLLFLGCIQR